jgi:hypothetical protein
LHCEGNAQNVSAEAYCVVRGEETEHVRGKGAKANSATLECDIFRFGAWVLQCEGNAQNVKVRLAE